MDNFPMKRGDTLPPMLYAIDPASTDLTGASVIALMRLRSGESVPLAGVASVAIATGTPTVRYQWAAADTANPGLFEFEFEVTFPGGGRQTFPRIGFIQVPIGEDIATAVSVAPPVSISAPVISGTAQVGQVLTASAGTWTNSPTGIAWQWRRGGTTISGATGGTYTLVSADVGNAITAQVTASNASGASAPAISAPTATVAEVSLFAEIMALSSTAGVPAGTVLKVPGVDVLAGLEVSGQTIFLNAGVGEVVGWDFRGYSVRPTAIIPRIANCMFGSTANSRPRFLLDMYVGARVNVLEYCTFDGLPGAFDQDCIYDRFAADGMSGHVVVIRRNRFVNGHSDYIKGSGSAVAGGQVIEYNEFGQLADLPQTTPTVWNASTTYAIGAHVIDTVNNPREMVSKVNGNLNNPVPGGTVDNAFWDVLDRHIDLVSPSQCRFNGMTIRRNKIGFEASPHRYSFINNTLRIGGNSTETLYNAPLNVTENVLFYGPTSTTFNMIHVGDAYSPDFSGNVNFTGNWIKRGITAYLYEDSEGFINSWTGNVDYDTLLPITITGQTVVPITLTAEASVTPTDNGATVTYAFRDPVAAASANPNPVVLRTLTVDAATIPESEIGFVGGAYVYAVNKGAAPQNIAMAYTVRHGRSPDVVRTVSATVPAAAVAVPVNTAPPVITGTAQVGQTLTGTEGAWTGSPTITLQWLRGSTAISGATGLTYVPVTDDVGAALSLRATATNAGGASAPATSAATAAVVAAGVAEPITFTVLDPHDNTTGWTATVPTTLSTGAPVYGAVGSTAVDLNNGGGGGVPINIQKNAMTWPGVNNGDLIMFALAPPANPMDGEIGGAGIVFAANHAFRGDTVSGEPQAGGTGSRHGAKWFSMAVDSIRAADWNGTTLAAVAAGTTMQRITYTPTNIVGDGTARFGPLIRVTQRRKPIIGFTFDDGYKRELTDIVPMMEARFGAGIAPGTSYVPMGLVGTSLRYTLADLAAMKAKGWGICLDSHPTDDPIWGGHGGSIADAVASLNAHRASLVATGLATVEEASHICYSYGPTSPISDGAATVANCTANGTTTITSTNSFYNAGAMRGVAIKAPGVPAGTTIVSCESNSIVVSQPVPAGTYTLTMCGVFAPTSNGTLVANGTTTITSIRTDGIVVGMTMQGRGVPVGTTVTAINVEGTPVTANGTITVSQIIPATTTRASFFIAGSEWLPGNLENALIAAGYRTGRRTKAFGGICTQFGIPSAMAMMSLSSVDAEAATANATIQSIAQNIRDGRDSIGLMHASPVADMTRLGLVLDYVAARRNAGELDVMNVPEWYNRVAARSGIA